MIKSCAAVAVTLTFVQGAAALPGPPLRTEPASLAGAVTCAGPDLRTAAKPPVLLVHGTFVTDEPWRGGAYEALQAAGYPTCLAHVANRELGDVQTSVEYVVAAIREVAQRAGRPIAVIGHSPGSAMLTALHHRHVYPGPDYTAVSTTTDEVVTPQPRGGLLDGARQIAVQDICPGRYVEHGAMTTDAVAFAPALTASRGPAPARCAQPCVLPTSAD